MATPNLGVQQLDQNELYQSVRIVSLLIKFDEEWLSGQQELVAAFKAVWCNDEYQVS